MECDEHRQTYKLLPTLGIIWFATGIDGDGGVGGGGGLVKVVECRL